MRRFYFFILFVIALSSAVNYTIAQMAIDTTKIYELQLTKNFSLAGSIAEHCTVLRLTAKKEGSNGRCHSRTYRIPVK